MLYLALAFVGKMVYIYCINICIIGTPRTSTSMLSCYQPLTSLSPVFRTRSHWIFSGSCLNDLMYELYLGNLLRELLSRLLYILSLETRRSLPK